MTRIEQTAEHLRNGWTHAQIYALWPRIGRRTILSYIAAANRIIHGTERKPPAQLRPNTTRVAVRAVHASCSTDEGRREFVTLPKMPWEAENSPAR